MTACIREPSAVAIRAGGFSNLRSIRFVPRHRLLETRAVAFLVLLVGILAWLWPIGVGGMMPLGGDVTQFFLGLMAFYRESLAGGRLPVWNDLWGYGFPGSG